MKKGLVSGVILVAAGFLFCNIALAAITTQGTLELKIVRSSEKPAGAEVATPLSKYGDVRMHYDVKVTSGPWEALFAPRIRLDGEPQFVEDDGSYLKVTLSHGNFVLKPRLDYEIFHVYAYGPDGVIDGGANIPKKPGIKINLPIKSLNMSLDLAVNNSAVYKDTGMELTGTGDQKTKWNYGAGLAFGVKPITLALKLDRTNVKDAAWHGSSYGVRLKADLAPLTLTAEFANWSPEARHLRTGSGLYGEIAYTLCEGLGRLALEYKKSDKKFNGAGYGPSPRDYYKITGRYSFLLAKAVRLSLALSRADKGYGDRRFTEFEVKVTSSF
ncbi:MAG: hypothetical protein ACE5K3_10060 [bacterium]